MLSLIYFYAHYGFASISAHALAMYTPFLIVGTLAGAPPFLAAALLAYFSNLSAGLTHYGTTPGPIYFGADYVTQQKWRQLGLIASVSNILIWALVGLVWWKIMGWRRLTVWRQAGLRIILKKRCFMEIILTIPDELTAEAQNGKNGASLRRLLEYVGVELYKADVISGPQLQEMLGLESRFELDGVLKAHGVFFDYSPEQLAREVETIERLKETRAT